MCMQVKDEFSFPKQCACAFHKPGTMSQIFAASNMDCRDYPFCTWGPPLQSVRAGFRDFVEDIGLHTARLQSCAKFKNGYA